VQALGGHFFAEFSAKNGPMDDFTYRDGRLHAEGVDLNELADRIGTPTYVYSAATLRTHYRTFAAAFSRLSPQICFSIKSCSNLGVLKTLVDQGAGLDAVSGGEVERAWLAGCPMERVAFAGVGKSDAEIRAALDGRFSLLGEAAAIGRGPVGCFNVESEAEFETIAGIARELGVRAHAALRVNPDVDAKTHAYTTTGKKENKFGVDLDRALAFFDRYGRDDSLRLDALHIHLGSPIYTVEPYVEAIHKLLALIDTLASRGHAVRTLDLGGGFGADYTTGRSPAPADYASAIVPLLEARVRGGLRIMMEPGRMICANAGVLLTRVLYVKPGATKTFVIGDAGMHTLIRPSLYGAFHFIWPADCSAASGRGGFVPHSREERSSLPGLMNCDVVGPICESSDFLAKDRPLPPVRRGDVLAVFTAGAYGMSMASHYNTHMLPAEVLVDGREARVMRARETLADVLKPERAALARP
jgi:diaminopimelate decarboxylase